MPRDGLRARLGCARALIAVCVVALTACQSSQDRSSNGPVGPSTTGPAATPKPTTTAPRSTSSPTSTRPALTIPTTVDASGFNDHTVPRIATTAEFMALARTERRGSAVVKFTFTNPNTPSGPVHLYDSNFYRLHDEWYYFRLLNGQPVDGAQEQPWYGRRFASVRDVYDWALAQPASSLPIGLKVIDGRLASTDFYSDALSPDSRRFGVGSIVAYTDPTGADPTPRWLLELEHSDYVSPEWIATVMTRVSSALPPEIATNLTWVVRSPMQDAVAKEMTSRRLPFHDRLARYSDFVKAGTTAVYSEGIAAGRLHYISPDVSADTNPDGSDDGDAELSAVKAGDIVITEHVPDWLPPANAVITSDPQTPLAHINLLARNRRIPNLSRASIHLEPAIRRAADVHAYALVIARGNSAQIALITGEQYSAWVRLRNRPAAAVDAIETSKLPMTVDLTDLARTLQRGGVTTAEIDTWRPIIGGKSAGFLSLLSTPGLAPPPDPIAITIRPYVEHIASLVPLIARAIDDPVFKASPRARWLVLEGPDSYAEQFPTTDDRNYRETFVATHRRGTPLGDIVAQGGIRAIIEAKPIDAATLADITNTLKQNYPNLDVNASLRFRSSSSVEDIEGFNGAGLYTSTSGYLYPERTSTEKAKNATVERAVARAWSSYWSAEAFEERRLENIDHLSGAMGLTVHPRFDDDLERNNGVATFTFLPTGEPDDAELDINVQAGSVAVTNPDPAAKDLPEVIRVRRIGGVVTIGRVSRSTLSPNSSVLDDAAATELFDQTAAVATQWRTRLNRGLPTTQQIRTTVLDFEFKSMLAGWPRVSSGPTFPARLVIRQVRSLDPGMRDLPPTVRRLPIRRDLLMRAAQVTEFRCGVGPRKIVFTEVVTDPLRQPDMGHATEAFISGSPPPDRARCVSTVLYASPDHYLIGLLRNPDVFIVSG